jgi:hypothetical protein
MRVMDSPARHRQRRGAHTLRGPQTRAHILDAAR